MVAEYVVQWSGARIGTGATVWHIQNPVSEGSGTAAGDIIREWYDALKGNYPNDCTWTFPPEMRVLDDATGNLVRIDPVGVGTPIIGTGNSVFTNGTGAMMRLTTAQVAGNRALQGRIFFVPATAAVFGENGDVLPAIISAHQPIHNALLADLTANGTNLQVWSRTHGLSGDVTGMRTVPRPSSLRTRNDR